jgi:hypothetical protein
VSESGFTYDDFPRFLSSGYALPREPFGLLKPPLLLQIVAQSFDLLDAVAAPTVSGILQRHRRKSHDEQANAPLDEQEDESGKKK